MNRLFAAVIAAFVVLSTSAYAGNNDLVLGKFSATPYVEIQSGDVWNQNSHFNNQTLYGVATGLDFGKFRTELNYQRADMGKTTSATFGYVNSDVIGSNLYLQPCTIHNFTPYVGGGVGYSYNTGTGTKANDRDDYVYNLAGGFTYRFTPNWAADVGYRYSTSQDRNITGGNSKLIEYNEGQAIVAGWRYSF